MLVNFSHFYPQDRTLHSILDQKTPNRDTGAAISVSRCRRRARGSIYNRRLRACANNFRPMASGMCPYCNQRPSTTCHYPAGALICFFCNAMFCFSLRVWIIHFKMNLSSNILNSVKSIGVIISTVYKWQYLFLAGNQLDPRARRANREPAMWCCPPSKYHSRATWTGNKSSEAHQ